VKCKRDSDGKKRDDNSLQTMCNQAVKDIGNGQTVHNVAKA